MTKKQPQILTMAGWLTSFFAFGIGFWHTHLGLRSFEILSSSNGSLVLSFLILLVLLISYYSAVNGRKIAIFFYLICALFYFTFNMTSLYPNRLGRKLVTEEAIVINNDLQNFTSKVNREFGNEGVIKKYNSIRDLRNLLIHEILNENGFGERAKDYLLKINKIFGSDFIKPSIKVGSTIEERNNIANKFAGLINDRLKSYIEANADPGKGDIINRINEVKSMYEPKLSGIIEDNSKINIDSVKSNPQIKVLQQIATKMDNIRIDANKISSNSKQNIFGSNYGVVKSQYLGTFEHTIRSVYDRLNKIDTWGIIILCLFIDIVVPLAVYFMIRKGDDDTENYGNPPTGFRFPGQKKPVNFNRFQ